MRVEFFGGSKDGGCIEMPDDAEYIDFMTVGPIGRIFAKSERMDVVPTKVVRCLILVRENGAKYVICPKGT